MEANCINGRIRKKEISLDPRSKTLLCVVTSIIMISGKGQGVLRFIEPCLAILPIVFLFSLKKYKRLILYVSVYSISVMLSRILLPYSEGILASLIILISAAFTKLLPGFMMGYFIIETTKVSEFISAMEKMHMPKCLTIPFSVMFRFFPTIREEYGYIRDSIKIRNLKFGFNIVKILEYNLVPLLMSVVIIGNDLSVSALTRALGANIKRTSINELSFGILDYITFLFTFICFVGFILSKLGM
mgnify:FL=1